MKQSHITTPRTLAECPFAHNADPIERLEQMHKHDRIVVFASLVAVVLLAGVLLREVL